MGAQGATATPRWNKATAGYAQAGKRTPLQPTQKSASENMRKAYTPPPRPGQEKAHQNTTAKQSTREARNPMIRQ